MNSTENEICRLCGEKTHPFFDNEFFHCENCKGISRKLTSLPDAGKEKKRYDQHQNSPDDGYEKFISPIMNYVLRKISNEKIGLDFGSGPNSILSNILAEKKYTVYKFDPFYENDSTVLKNTFDFIIACEVIEHFHYPQNEFKKLKEKLNKKGELLIMTHLYDFSINFENWYYKNDFTHVFFYTQETFEWIKKQYDFTELEINDRFIRLKN
jgi:SAM-dependent methyltransferase